MAARTWSRIETLFLEAVDLPVERRAGFLDSACGGDRELRAELDSLLAKDESHDDPIATALAEEAALLLKPAKAGPERMGAYRVLREIGRGGMGAVYLAERDDRQYRQLVAIKLVKRGTDTTEVLRRFHHERQILAGLEHPYIARLLDGGSSGDGRPFLVMELVEGTPIDDYCADYSLAIEDRCRLFLKVCEAVFYAHRKLVVHRDLKPGNILVSAPGSGNPGCPKLLDFGLAKLLAPQGEPGSAVTVAAARRLTPDYASPEQIRGAALSTATDVYSLGVILHELLAGVRPHNLQGVDPGQWQQIVCQHEVARPSSLCSSDHVASKLRGDLDHILMKALRKDPDRRYASVDEFAADIRRHLECRPVVARPDSFSYRVARFLRRRRLPLLAASTAFAALVTGTAIAIEQARDAVSERRVAETRQQEAQTARTLAEAEHRRAEGQRDSAVAEQQRAEVRLTQMLSLSERSLADVDSLMERLPGAGPARRELAATTLAFLEKLSRDAGADIRLRLALAKAYLRLGDLQVDPGADRAGGLKSYQTGSAVLGAVRDREHLQVWLTLEKQASTLILRTDPRTAIQRLHTAVGELQRQPAEVRNATEFIRLGASLNRTLSLAFHADPAQARKYASEYLSASAALSARNSDDPELRHELSAAHVEMGWVLWALGDPQAAEAHYRKAIDLREQLFHERPTDVVYRRTLMLAYEHLAGLEGGGLVNNLGHPELASAGYRKALPLAEEGAVDPNNTVAASDYAVLLLRMASIDVPPEGLPESLAMLRKSAAWLESLRASGRRDLDVFSIDAYLFTGHRLLALGEYVEAVGQYKRALALAATLRDVDAASAEAAQRVVQAEGGIAVALALSGDRPGALEWATRAAAHSSGRGVDQTVAQSLPAQAEITAASVHLAFREYAEARGAAEHALSMLMPSTNGWNANARIVREAESVIAACDGRQ